MNFFLYKFYFLFYYEPNLIKQNLINIQNYLTVNQII